MQRVSLMAMIGVSEERSDRLAKKMSDACDGHTMKEVVGIFVAESEMPEYNSRERLLLGMMLGYIITSNNDVIM